MREAVGLFDQSSFAKFRMEGPDAKAVLQKLCANDLDVGPGRIVYTAMLNRRGGVECDLTVTRLAEEAYLIVTAAAASTHDADWIRRHLGDALGRLYRRQLQTFPHVGEYMRLNGRAREVEMAGV